LCEAPFCIHHQQKERQIKLKINLTRAKKNEDEIILITWKSTKTLQKKQKNKKQTKTNKQNQKKDPRNLIS
jgi:hypothetical protein